MTDSRPATYEELKELQRAVELARSLVAAIPASDEQRAVFMQLMGIEDHLATAISAHLPGK